MANTNSLLRTNSFKIVGTLVSADSKIGTRKDNGQEYISVTATIGSTVDGKATEYEVSFFTSKLTKDGKESQLFTSYSKLGELEGKKVEVTGEFRENRYWSENLGQMVSAQQLSGRFVRGVAASTEDVATYEIGGFVVKELVEKTNKKNEVYRYDITLGQSNFSGNAMSMFVLHVNPNDKEIIAGVKNYQVGQTIKLNGTLDFTVEQVTVEDKSNAFGTPVTKTFTNRQKNFYIKGGSNPLTDDTKYTNEDIRNFIDAYKANDVALQSNAANSASSSAATTAAPVTKRQTSLI